jgi:hypothetical protein
MRRGRGIDVRRAVGRRARGGGRLAPAVGRERVERYAGSTVSPRRASVTISSSAPANDDDDEPERAGGEDRAAELADAEQDAGPKPAPAPSVVVRHRLQRGPGGADRVERRDVLGLEREGAGGEVLLEVADRRRAGDQQDALVAVQQPRERDL